MLDERKLKAMRGALFMRRNGLKETDQAYRDTTDAMALVDALLAGDAMASLWWVEDVLGLSTNDDGEPDGTITIETARKVLAAAERNHNAEYGINWDSLRSELEYIQEQEAKNA